MANPWEEDRLRARRYAHRIASGMPHREEQIGVLCTLAAAFAPRRILDLGTGPALVAHRLLQRLPEAEVTGLDASAGMLEEARVTLGEEKERVRLVRGRLEEPWPYEVGGDYDLVVSAQAIHHVEGRGKRAVYRRAFEALRPGGLFLVSDRLALDERFFGLYRRLWNRERARGDHAPLPDTYDAESYRARLAESGDVPERLQVQLRWLADVGFDPVESFWQHADRAAFGGLRPLRG